MIKNFKWLLLVSLTFAACNSDDDETVAPVVITPGSANFSNYVALGDSFAAGFSDGALFIAGQQNAYPNLLAQQFTLAGGGEFTTPFMNDNFGGFASGGVQVPQFPVRLYLNTTETPEHPDPTPDPVPGAVSTTELTAHLTGPFNNMGIPGAKSFHLVTPGYATLNPYFGRFASSASAKVIDDAVAQNPSFFSLWIGGNDVLSYAMAGGSGEDRTGNMDPSTYGPNDITDPTVFAGTYSGLVNGLTANGAKGVVANLPYINALPFFTTVPYNPVPLDGATAALLMGPAAYGPYNAGLDQAQLFGLITEAEKNRRKISFAAGLTNPVVIVDSYLTNLSGLGLPSYRQATEEDLIILPARNFIGTTVGGNAMLINGVSVPLADNWVLSPEEIALIRNATDAYNATIQSIATAKGLAFVDTKAIMEQLMMGGVVRDGYTITSTYVTGGAFSLDGIHPSPRGYAFIANLFADAINAKYGSNLPAKNMGDYRILFPMTL